MALIIGNSVESLTKLSKALKNPEALNRVTSTAVAREVRSVFTAIESKEKNKFGRPPTFWSKMIKSVRPVFSATSALVEMNRAIALRYFGGIVRPTGGKKFLTIPVSKDAYNKSARSFPNLFVFRYGGDGANGKAYLAMQDRKGDGIGPGKKDKLTLMYLLLRSTKHKADKSVLPTAERIKKVMSDAIAEYLKRKTQ
jgi:hypothetical protein